MVQYYSLEESARMLGVSVEELKKMAQRNEIRSFSDRGTMRFRAQEIDQLRDEGIISISTAPPRRFVSR